MEVRYERIAYRRHQRVFQAAVHTYNRKSIYVMDSELKILCVRQYYSLTEPILGPVKRMMDKSPLGGGMMLDFSPVIALFILDIIQIILLYIVRMF